MRARRLLVLAAASAALLSGTAHAQQGPYPPPAEVQGKVAPARIKQGQCTTFSGRGFSAGATITLADGAEPKGTTQANNAGKFAQRLCYPGDARAGRHDLSGSGQTASGVQAATATLTITGVEESGGAGVSAASNGEAVSEQAFFAGLPLTGLPLLALALTGTALAALGAFLLLLTERRHRLRRRSRTATA